MKKTFSAVTGIMLALMMLFVSCDGSGSGVPSANDIRTKSDLMASIPGVAVPPESGTKSPDEATVALVKSVLDKLNSDYKGEAYKELTGFREMKLGCWEGTSAKGYIFGETKFISADEMEQIINGKLTSNGKEIVFSNVKVKMNESTGSYSESGSATVNGKSVGVKEAMNFLPRDEESLKEYWSLDVSNYRSGTYSVFSGREPEEGYYKYSDGIVVLNITADGHKVQLKYTCPSDASSFRYNSDCSLKYVAIDGSFYDTAKIQESI